MKIRKVTFTNRFGELVEVEVCKGGRPPVCDHGFPLVTFHDCHECLAIEEKWQDSHEQMRLVWLERSEWTTAF